MEKEVLGFYLSSHPLSEYEQQLATYCTHQTSQLDDLREKTEVFVGGMLSALRLAHVKKAKENGNTKYAMFDLEDMLGAVRCILWPEDYAKYGELVQHDAILVARASVDRGRGGDEINLVVNELIPLDELGSRYTHGVQIHVHEAEHDAQTLKKLHEITRAYPGNCELQLVLNLANGQRVALKSNKLRVDVQHEFKDRVEELLSPGHFRLLTSGPKASTPKAKPHR